MPLALAFYGHVSKILEQSISMTSSCSGAVLLFEAGLLLLTLVKLGRAVQNNPNRSALGILTILARDGTWAFLVTFCPFERTHPQNRD